MIKSALVFVPHPDDEINIAGGVFEILHRNKIFTTVVITTNGDYISEDADKRFYEAKKAQKILGYQELIFLGYGDGYIGTHIYNTVDKCISKSCCGRNQTYCAGNEYEFCYDLNRKHHTYTRENYKNDICSVILHKKADLVICVDLDSHLEHKCLSLLFDECMGEILKYDHNYRPIILKGFAYNGVWFGPYDFFSPELRQTTIELAKGESLDKKVFPYSWGNRIQIKTGQRTLTRNLFRNIIVKALLAHKTQSDYYKVGFCALNCFPRIANPDACYWYRSTSNIALYSQFESSSGDVSYLNDFMLAKPYSTLAEDLSVCSKGWKPVFNDKAPFVSIKFPREISLAKIVIYQNLNSSVRGVTCKTDEGIISEYNYPEGHVINISLPGIKTQGVNLTFFDINEHFTINEIECYEDGNEFPWAETPFVEYKHSIVKRSVFINIFVKICFKLYVKILIFQSRLRKNKQ